MTEYQMSPEATQVAADIFGSYDGQTEQQRVDFQQLTTGEATMWFAMQDHYPFGD